MRSEKIYRPNSQKGYLIKFPNAASDGTVQVESSYRAKKSHAEAFAREKEEQLCRSGAGGILSPSEVDDLQQALNLLGGHTSLREAASFWRSHHPDHDAGTRTADAVER